MFSVVLLSSLCENKGYHFNFQNLNLDALSWCASPPVLAHIFCLSLFCQCVSVCLSVCVCV